MKCKGGCHCGRVRYEVEIELNQVISCNCSICSKKGQLLVFTDEENFTLVSGEDVLSDYQFGKRSIHHYFCSLCGVGPFGRGKVPGSNKKMRAVNIRSLDEINVADIKVKEFDGRSL